MPAGGKGKTGREKNKLPRQKGVVQMENDEAWETAYTPKCAQWLFVVCAVTVIVLKFNIILNLIKVGKNAQTIQKLYSTT